MSGQEQTPEESERNLDELGARIAHWNSALAQADPSEITKVANAAIEECDELWSYQDAYCTFSGKGVFPEITENGGITIAVNEIVGEGYSRGFSVYDFVGNGGHRLYHTFFLGTHQTSPHPSVANAAMLFAYMDTNSIIIPHSEVDDILLPRNGRIAGETLDVQQRMEKIDDQSLRLVRLLQSRRFRKQSVAEQQSILDNYVARCEQSYDLRDTHILFEAATYCCRPYLLPEDEVKYEFITLGDTLVKGTFLGLGTLERETLKRKPIRRTEDLVNKAAGLCLVVSVEEASEPTGLRENDIIYVPTADQDMDATFFIRDRVQTLNNWLGNIPPSGEGPEELVG